MKITKVEAFAIKIAPDQERDPNQNSADVGRYGDYFIAADAWTSIY